MELNLFTQLSLVLAIAAGISVVLRLFRQPLILGYIITGVVVGPSLLNLLRGSHSAFESYSQIGVALLLFIVGLGLNVTTIKALGKPVMVVMLIKTVVIGGLGYVAALLLGLKPVDAMIISAGTMFSSTIVIIKALSDKRAITRLYGNLTVALALVEDVLATIALLAVTAAKGHVDARDVEVLLAKGFWLAVGLIGVGAYIMPKLSRFFATSQELLFMFALTWAFGIASLFEYAGFSIEVGALFAGVSLAALPYSQEISTRLKPLRDFFLVLFFVVLGERLSLSGIESALIPALVISSIIVVVKTGLVAVLLSRLGYTAQTSAKTGIHLSQISEFSVILAVLAQTSGLTGGNVVNILTLTALITIAVSSYMMKYDDDLFRWLEKPLKLFERPNPVLERRHADYKLILFGYHKGGHEFIDTFRELRRRYVVVDYDPEVIEILERQHINHIFGDATDYELLEEIGVHKADLVVSTITDLATNKLLTRHVMQWNPDGVFICHAASYDDAAELYEHGATYVMLPHLIGSEQMSHFIKKNGSKKNAFEKYRKRHIVDLGKAALAS